MNKKLIMISFVYHYLRSPDRDFLVESITDIPEHKVQQQDAGSLERLRARPILRPQLVSLNKVVVFF